MSKLIIKKRQGLYVIPAESIIYMEKNLRKICLYVRDAGRNMDQRFEFYGKFSDLLPQLDDRFMYCHRSYVINMDAIVWMAGCEIYISPDISIHIGRDAYGRARKIFVDYLNKKYPEKTLKNTKFFL